jgi:uncharacterized protein (TIGR02147 family)
MSSLINLIMQRAISTSDLKVDSAGIIRLKLQQAIQANPRYSLRAFAKKLGLSPGGLSLILSRKKQLSLSRAYVLADCLELNDSEKERFLLLVQLETAKSSKVKHETYEKLKHLSSGQSEVFNLSLEQFQMISEWYGLAMLEMITHFAGDWSSTQMAEYLGIPKVDAEVMLDRLQRLELIEQNADGNLQRVSDRMLVGSKVPNEAIRKYYHGVIQKSDASVEGQSPAEKIIGTEVFAFDPEQLEEVRKKTDEYLDSLLALARSGKNRTEVYQVMANVFRLSPKKNLQKKLEKRSKK